MTFKKRVYRSASVKRTFKIPSAFAIPFIRPGLNLGVDKFSPECYDEIDTEIRRRIKTGGYPLVLLRLFLYN